ncbi:hypothetical protein MFRU_001g03270 [Monilinia fructicola]|uniref:Zn(2)-C6 fungal-type domain-containing protein n=1 Tax=Monilinia fructicola TaxID=38448 RepID=A0A5M9JZY1_MONFR|nr:hypothetical protein EYC84_005305 [Monilinia fructicola]KAG4035558.1 hypothetical protein MFRU_001g03270 [Monilinia fructicola]
MINTSKDFTPLPTGSKKRMNILRERGDSNISQPHSPVSDQSKGPVDQARRGNMYQSGHSSTREQLPSINSLIDSVPPLSRPAQSPYSDRQSPVFPSTSSQDGRLPATPIHPDHSFDAKFQRPAASRQYSYVSRPDTLDRLGYPAPSTHKAPTNLGPMPKSPRYAPRYLHQDSRQGQLPPGTNWSHSDSNRQEPFQPLRAHPDQYRHQSHASRPEHESRPFSREHAPFARNYMPTPASTAMGEPVTVKDGLGPKIWTGTQFLPRFVKQADVAGEGLCYFYDDGTHCKTVIDGEVVNALWGVTKAGKPRKRLAIACITCREKKIKCDPDYPRCVQCDKFGRVCKFKNAPRGGQSSPDTPPADPEDSLPGPGSSNDGESFRVDDREVSHSVSPRQNPHRASPESEQLTKRQRNGYNAFTPVASEASPRLSIHEIASPTTAWAEEPMNRSSDHTLHADWQIDPFDSKTESDLPDELLAVFFKYVPETACCMFPKHKFTSWARFTRDKSLDDLMLIYSILALGATFSAKSEHKHLGARYAAIARYACDSRRICIQLVQARLILAVYYFAINNPNDSWDFCGSAVRAATGLKLNIEIEKSEDAYLKTFPFGLNFSGYAECRRRTFWSCYLMDRFNGFGSGHMSMVDPKHIYLRLPCDENSFESQINVQNPLFDVSSQLSQNYPRTLGPIAYMINLSTIWGDVMCNIYSNSQKSQPARLSEFTEFYQSTMDRLSIWKSTLPNSHAFSSEVLERMSDAGELNTYITIHALYHTTLMKLNRYVQPYGFDDSQILCHVYKAAEHAKFLLDIMNIVANRRKCIGARSPSSDASIEFTSPFVGYAIVAAVDILSARSTRAEIPSIINSFSGARSVIAEIAQFWQTAKIQDSIISKRVSDLTEVERKNWSSSAKELSNGTFEMHDPLENTFSRENDCIYQ